MTKVYVREHAKPAGWNIPEGNVLQVYLEECERLGVTANTGVVHQLEQRVRHLQKEPYHILFGKTREEKLGEVFDHLDTDGSGSLDIVEMKTVCMDINPMAQRDAAEEWVRFMDADGDNEVSKPEYIEAMDFMTQMLDDEMFDQGLLEVLSQPPDISRLSRENKHRAAFRWLDKDNSGFMDLQEFRNYARHISARATWSDAAESLKFMDADGDGRVSIQEYIEAMEFSTSWMSDEDLDVSVNEVFKKHMPYTYDFSRHYIGDKGCRALAKPLLLDLECEGLILRGCGIRSDGAEVLCAALSEHVSIKTVDLSGNPIGDRGAAALLGLLEANPKVVSIGIEGTDILRNKSRTHLKPGPLPFENGGPLYEAMQRNRDAKPKIREGANVAKIVLNKRDELKVLFYSLAGADGRVSMQELSDGLMSCGSEWGILPADLVMAINPQRMMKNGWNPSGGADDETSSISYAEFINALRAEDKGALVCDALQKRRADVKILFYTISGVDGRASMSEIFDTLQEAVTEQGEEWGVKVEDVVEVLVPRFFFDQDAFGEDGKDMMTETLNWSEFWLPIANFSAMDLDYMARDEGEGGSGGEGGGEAV